MPASGHKDPRQLESTSQVALCDESLCPQGSPRDPFEELINSLKGAGTVGQQPAHSPATSGQSTPCYKDLLSQTPEDIGSPTTQCASAKATAA